MSGNGPYLQLLSAIPAFAGLGAKHIRALYSYCALKVLAKGEAASVAGAGVNELQIIVSGRVTGGESGGVEAGRGAAIAARAFFTQQPAAENSVALRETVLLTLAWEDLLDALRADPGLLGALVSTLPQANHVKAARPSRLVICPAGAKGDLEPAVSDALLQAFESVAEVRLIGSKSFGAGMPGAISMADPQTAHFLQAQEFDFDLTITIAGEDLDFTKQAIETTDEVLFVAQGKDAALSALEEHAIEMRGRSNCRLLLPKAGIPSKEVSAWLSCRSYRTTQRTDAGSPQELSLMCSAVAGKGKAIAAASCGVYAAAIWGALQACEECGMAPVALTAGGSAILPAGLLAHGDFARAEAIFRELANPALWKRASRADAGLCDPAALDSFLVDALRDLQISISPRPFAAISHSLSEGRAEVHREGRLHGAVRAGLAPAGILPPLILDSGAILVSGEFETEALQAAAGTLTPSPALFIHTKAQPPGYTAMTYRELSAALSYRLTPFQSLKAIDKNVRIETILGSPSWHNISHKADAGSFLIPIPAGISSMDWPEWANLREVGYAWTLNMLEKGAAGPGAGPQHSQSFRG